MKSKLNLFIGLILISFIISSCSDERPGQIDKIKTNTELSNKDKILKIAKIATKDMGGDSISFEIQKDENGIDFLYVKILDKDFIFSSTKLMQSVVRSQIAKNIWRFLRDTKDLGIDEIGIEFYGNINTDEGSLDALVYQVFNTRNDFKDVAGFYDINPYNVGDYDVIDPGSEQDKVIDAIDAKMQILTDNSDQITF